MDSVPRVDSCDSRYINWLSLYFDLGILVRQQECQGVCVCVCVLVPNVSLSMRLQV